MEQATQGPSGESSAPSSFSGQKYNPSQNTTTHYKAGNGKPKKKKKSDKKSDSKKKIDGVVSVKTDKNKYSNGIQPDYAQASVFKKK